MDASMGRGAADDKSAIVAHIATIQAFESNYPVGIKIIVEGDEEFGSQPNDIYTTTS